MSIEAERDMFVKRWLHRIVGLGVCGAYSDAMDGPMKRAGNAIQTVELVPKLLKEIFDDLAARFDKMAIERDEMAKIIALEQQEKRDESNKRADVYRDRIKAAKSRADLTAIGLELKEESKISSEDKELLRKPWDERIKLFPVNGHENGVHAKSDSNRL